MGSRFTRPSARPPGFPSLGKRTRPRTLRFPSCPHCSTPCGRTGSLRSTASLIAAMTLARSTTSAKHGASGPSLPFVKLPS
jgi:hypothetical protein